MKRLLVFAGASAALIGVVGAVFWAVFAEPASRHAIGVSAAVAFGVQLLTFAILLLVRSANLFTAWGLGALVRFVVLVAFGFVAVKVMGMPAAPALLSLVTFFFLTTLVEPVLLKR